MCPIFNKSTKKIKIQKSFDFYIILVSSKPERCTGKLLKIKFKFIYLFIYLLFFFFCSNVVDKINKKTLRIGVKIDPTF